MRKIEKPPVVELVDTERGGNPSDEISALWVISKAIGLHPIFHADRMFAKETLETGGPVALLHVMDGREAPSAGKRVIDRDDLKFVETASRLLVPVAIIMRDQKADAAREVILASDDVHDAIVVPSEEIGAVAKKLSTEDRNSRSQVQHPIIELLGRVGTAGSV